ncbi:Uncharacterised protein [Candidatus Gugararchaeum adminiculabundum]|nr:Uncharacterised protein [Candidatus Gugararchaeum adminiculabundum]
MGFDFSGKKLDAVLIVLLLVFTVASYSYAPRSTLTADSYQYALQVKKSIAGEHQGFFPDMVAKIYRSAFSSMDLTKFLKYAALIYASLAILIFYACMRARFSQAVSAASGLMLACVPLLVFIAVAGVFTPDSFMVSTGIIGASLAFAAMNSEKLPLAALFSVLSLVFIAGAAAISSQMQIFALALAVAGVAQLVWTAVSEKEKIANSAIAAVCLLGAGAYAFASSPFSMPKIIDPVMAAIPGISAIAACAGMGIVVLALNREKKDVFALGLGILSLCLILTVPFAALPGLAIAAAFGFDFALGRKEEQKSSMLELALPTFFIASAALVSFAGMNRAVLVGAFLGIGILSIQYIYKENSGFVKKAALGFAGVLLVSSVILPALVSGIGNVEVGAPLLVALGDLQVGVPNELSPQLLLAFDYLKANSPQGSVGAAFGRGNAMEYLTGMEQFANDSEIAHFWISNSSVGYLKERGVSYVALDIGYLDNFDELATVAGDKENRIDSFVFRQHSYYDASQSKAYAVFQSSGNGRTLWMQVDMQGNSINGLLPNGDAFLADWNGAGWSMAGSVTFGRVRFLQDPANGNYTSPDNRAVYPYDSYNSNLFRIYFGEVPGLTQVYGGTGPVRIFKVD